MKSLHLTNAWHATSGGISTFYRELLAAADRRGHELRLVVPGERTGFEEAGEFGRIYTIAAPRAPLNSSYRMLMPTRFLTGRWSQIGRLLVDERPDVVEVCDKYSLLYFAGLLRQGWLPGVRLRPTLVGLTCERMDENVLAYVTRSPAGRLFSRLYMRHLYFPMFDHHIANSEHTADELRPASRGHDVRRGVWVFPMGVDCAGLGPEHRSPEKRRELIDISGGTPDSVLLLYAGRLAPEKNLELLAAAMELLARDSHRDYRLLVAGAGISYDSLRAQMDRRAPGRCSFLGHIGDRARLADLYANADVFVHPNPREPFGIAPLEAMASGLPLVVPDEGGVTTYANAANAWPTAPRAANFVSAIRAASTNPDRAAKIAAARRTAESYQWKNVADQFLQLYEDLHALRLGRRDSTRVAPRFFSTQPSSI